MRIRTATAGFTLLEVAVTVGVLGIVVMVAYGVFARVLEAKQITEARAEESAEARTFLGRLTSELRTASLGSRGRGTPGASGGRPIGAPSVTPRTAEGAPVGFVSVDRTSASTPQDEIAFSTVVRRPVSLAARASDLGVVHYFLRPEGNRRDRSVLYRESVPSLSEESIDLASPSPEASHAMLRGVAGLRFQFFDGEEWLEEWNSNEGRLLGRLPLGVRIWIAIEGPDGEVVSWHTAVDLPAARRTQTGPSLVPPGGLPPGGVQPGAAQPDAAGTSG